MEETSNSVPLCAELRAVTRGVRHGDAAAKVARWPESHAADCEAKQRTAHLLSAGTILFLHLYLIRGLRPSRPVHPQEGEFTQPVADRAQGSDRIAIDVICPPLGS
jgi:hypothetical protein